MERNNAPVGPTLLSQYIAGFAPKSLWEDLLERSKMQAVQTGVDFMSLSHDEVYLFKNAIALMRPRDGNGRWVEVGALTGFTALALLEVLGTDGRLWTMEKDPARASFLRDLFVDARLGGRIQVVEGDSRESKIRIQPEGPFEGIFIDGAKGQYFEDLKWAEEHIVRGGLIVADNIFLRGEVFSDEGDGHFSNKQTGVMKDFLTRVSDPARYQTVVLPTSDGMSVSRKLF